MSLGVVLIFSLVAHAACVPVTGDKIFASDLARANPAFQSAAPDLVISFAPLPGTQRVLPVRELIMLAQRLGVKDVTIDTAAAVCFERATEFLDPGQMRAAMAQALQIREDQIEIVDYSRYGVPAGKIEFTRAGLAANTTGNGDRPALWRGRVVTAGGKTVAVWAKVKSLMDLPVVVAVVELHEGQPIRPEQLEVTMKRRFNLESTYFDSREQASEKIPRRSVPAGTALTHSMLDEPRDVTQGELVQVTAGTGAAQITFKARAQSWGRKGDSILVQNPANGRTFRAKVVEKGKVEVRS